MRTAFTLVELLVAMVILLALMGIVLQMTGSVGNLWRRSRNSAEAFRGVRQAFESMTQTLGQATLHSYLDYLDQDSHWRTNANAAAFIPYRYARQSELQFVCGKTFAKEQLGSRYHAARQLTDAVFFQAPLGRAGDSGLYGGLDQILNAVGYYVDFNDDSANRPDSLPENAPSGRCRFRLMQYIDNSEALGVYKTTATTEPEWISQSVDPTGTCHVVAENVIALGIIPESGKDTPIVGDLEYNSRKDATADPQPVTANQLPPMIQVILVAIDEDSAMRLQQEYGESQPDLGFDYDEIFASGDTAAVEGSIAKIKQGLLARRIDYHIFRAEIPMQNSK